MLTHEPDIIEIVESVLDRPAIRVAQHCLIWVAQQALGQLQQGGAAPA